MSFFDEREPTVRRPAPGHRRSVAGRRRPPGRRAIRERRAAAGVAVVIVVLLVALAVHGCQASEQTAALADYSNNVAMLISQSDETGGQFFGQLSRGTGASGATGLLDEIDRDRVSADAELSRARRIAPPGQVAAAQRNLLFALELRRDAIANVATELEPAFQAGTGPDAIDAIAREMGRLYASDVVYEDYALPVIVGALHAGGIAVGGAGRVTIDPGQFVPDLAWLTPGFVAANLGVQLPARKPAPGIHGDRMDSVSVDGKTLQIGATNTVSASPAPTFTSRFTNDGQDPETDVVVKVSISGTSAGGQAVVPQTTPGQQATAQITLNSSPPTGTYTVSATVERVPGETALTHNTLSFPVTFK